MPTRFWSLSGQGSCLHDLGLDPSSPMSRVKQALVQVAAGAVKTGSDHTSGRWADFVDTFSTLLVLSPLRLRP